MQGYIIVEQQFVQNNIVVPEYQVIQVPEQVDVPVADQRIKRSDKLGFGSYAQLLLESPGFSKDLI